MMELLKLNFNMIANKDLDIWIKKYPIINDIINLNETFWQNEKVLPLAVWFPKMKHLNIMIAE